MLSHLNHYSSPAVKTVKMRVKYPGTWLLHCHVVDHIKAGMEAMYTVTEKGKTPTDIRRPRDIIIVVYCAKYHVCVSLTVKKNKIIG